jgi:hypothetical protein
MCYLSVALESVPGSRRYGFSGKLELVDPAGDVVWGMSGSMGGTDQGRAAEQTTVHAMRTGEYRLRVGGAGGAPASTENVHVTVRDITKTVLAAGTNAVTDVDAAWRRFDADPRDQAARKYLHRYWARNAHDRACAAQLLTNTFLPDIVCEPEYTVGSTVMVTFVRSVTRQPSYPSGPYLYEVGIIVDDQQTNSCWHGKSSGASGARFFRPGGLTDEPGTHQIRSWCRFRWFAGRDANRSLTNELWRLEWQGTPFTFEVIPKPHE